jgi:hypothetical protein
VHAAWRVQCGIGGFGGTGVDRHRPGISAARVALSGAGAAARAVGWRRQRKKENAVRDRGAARARVRVKKMVNADSLLLMSRAAACSSRPGSSPPAPPSTPSPIAPPDSPRQILRLPPAPRDKERDLASLKFESEHTPDTYAADLGARASIGIDGVARRQLGWRGAAPAARSGRRGSARAKTESAVGSERG